MCLAPVLYTLQSSTAPVNLQVWRKRARSHPMVTCIRRRNVAVHDCSVLDDDDDDEEEEGRRRREEKKKKKLIIKYNNNNLIIII